MLDVISRNLPYVSTDTGPIHYILLQNTTFFNP